MFSTVSQLKQSASSGLLLLWWSSCWVAGKSFHYFKSNFISEVFFDVNFLLDYWIIRELIWISDEQRRGDIQLLKVTSMIQLSRRKLTSKRFLVPEVVKNSPPLSSWIITTTTVLTKQTALVCEAVDKNACV